MGYQVVKCPRGHIKPTRTKSFLCHGRRFDTLTHIYDVAVERAKAQARPAKAHPARARATPEAIPGEYQPFTVEVKR